MLDAELAGTSARWVAPLVVTSGSSTVLQTICQTSGCLVALGILTPSASTVANATTSLQCPLVAVFMSTPSALIRIHCSMGATHRGSVLLTLHTSGVRADMSTPVTDAQVPIGTRTSEFATSVNAAKTHTGGLDPITGFLYSQKKKFMFNNLS